MEKSNEKEKTSHTIFIMIWIVRTIFDKDLVSKTPWDKTQIKGKEYSVLTFLSIQSRSCKHDYAFFNSLG